MKSKVKALLSFFMVLCMSCSMCATAFAAELPTGTTYDECEVVSDVSVEPRIGIAGYVNHYHDGSSYYGQYTISTNSITMPMKQYTVQLSDFNANSCIVIDIFNSSGKHMQSLSFNKTGNGKWENLPLNSLYFTNGDTYTIRYNVWNSNGSPMYGDDGWIGIWIY